MSDISIGFDPIGVGSGLIGGILNQYNNNRAYKEQQRQYEQSLQFQKEQAKYGAGWRMQDLMNQGVHKTVAAGVAPPSGSAPTPGSAPQQSHTGISGSSNVNKISDVERQSIETQTGANRANITQSNAQAKLLDAERKKVDTENLLNLKNLGVADERLRAEIDKILSDIGLNRAQETFVSGPQTRSTDAGTKLTQSQTTAQNFDNTRTENKLERAMLDDLAQLSHNSSMRSLQRLVAEEGYSMEKLAGALARSDLALLDEVGVRSLSEDRVYQILRAGGVPVPVAQGISTAKQLLAEIFGLVLRGNAALGSTQHRTSTSME